MTVDAAQTELVVTVARVADDALISAVVVGVASMTAARPENVVVALQALAVMIAVLVFLLSAAPIGDDLTVAAGVARVIADALVVADHVRAVAMVTAHKLRRVAYAEVDVRFAVVTFPRGAIVPAGDARAYVVMRTCRVTTTTLVATGDAVT